MSAQPTDDQVHELAAIVTPDSVAPLWWGPERYREGAEAIERSALPPRVAGQVDCIPPIRRRRIGRFRAWHSVRVNEPASLASDAGGPRFSTVPEVAERLGVKVTRIHQLLRERAVVAVPRPTRIPAEFFDPSTTDGVVKGLAGTITLLTDAGFGDDEIVAWLWAPDDTLPGRPIDALRENRGREVHRRAQAAGF